MMQDNNPKQTSQVFKKYVKAKKKTKRKKQKRHLHTPELNTRENMQGQRAFLTPQKAIILENMDFAHRPISSTLCN